MPDASARGCRLSSDQIQQLELAINRFRDAWENGGRPDVALFVPADPVLRQAALIQLILVDLELCWKRGTGRHVEDYLGDFPELGQCGTLPTEVILGEYRARCLWGDRPPATHVLDRYPDLASELQPLLKEVDLKVAAILQTTFDGGPLTSEVDDDSSSRTTSQMFIGPAFADRYEILGEIGRGGMGIVYRVHDRRRNEIVALKTLQWIDPLSLYRFKREFRAIADVVHPHLVTLHELVSDGRYWYFTMEYVEGRNILEYVLSASDSPRGPRNDDEQARAAGGGARLYPAQMERLRDSLGQLAEAIEFLHAAGKLHRDIKPQNILVTAQGRVVLLDFGLVADLEGAVSHLSTERHVVGTRAYMSPEQAAVLPVTPATDWYSLGVVLYQVLTGKLPFSKSEMIQEKQIREPPLPRALAPWIPDDLNELCRDLLKLQAEARPRGPEILSRLGCRVSDAGGARPEEASGGIGELLGRESHLTALADAFDQLARGRTEVAIVAGQSGIGKSALVQCFLDRLRGRGPVVVLRGKCHEQESMPYKALDGVVDSLSRYLTRQSGLEVEAVLPRDVGPLARLFPVLRRVQAIVRKQRDVDPLDPHELRRRAISGLRELLARIGDRVPLVLFVDDLQWGDPDSAAVLADLLHPPDQPRLLLVGCFRNESSERCPIRESLEALRAESGAAIGWRTVRVDALSNEESVALALRLTGSADLSLAAQGERLAQESGGNPFFLRELVRFLTEQKGLADGADKWAFTLDDILYRRALSLPDQGRRLLEAIAIAGRPLLSQDAFRAAELPSGQASILTLLRTERLLRTSGAGNQILLETYHDRIRETIVARLSDEERQHHHGRLAAALEDSPDADPEELALHFLAAGDQIKAGRFFTQAAERADQALAFQRSVELYRRALALDTALPPSTTLQIRYADALANCGLGIDAAKTYLAAAAGQQAGAYELRQKAALHLLISGAVDDGLSILREVLDHSGFRYPQTPLRALLSLIVNRIKLRARRLDFGSTQPGSTSPAALRRLDACWSAVVGLYVTRQIMERFQTAES